MKKKRFQKIYIEIINRCNLCCSFCPTSDRPSRMMSVDEFEKVAAQAAPFTDYICLHVKGEPLMHPWLGDILSIAHQNGLKVNLTTNAVLLPEKQQLLLGETAPRQISLSLHSFDANIMHDRNFRSYLENAIDFARTFTMTTPGYISFRLWNVLPKPTSAFATSLFSKPLSRPIIWPSPLTPMWVRFTATPLHPIPM